MQEDYSYIHCQLDIYIFSIQQQNGEQAKNECAWTLIVLMWYIIFNTTAKDEEVETSWNSMIR